MKDAPILILDDSVSAVDTKTEKNILSSLKHTRAGRTTILIAHRISTVEDMDKITGLTLGADDYMTKPFNPLELVARVKTQLRRYTRYNIHSENAAVNASSTIGTVHAGGEGAAFGAAHEQEELDIRGLYISKKSHKCTLNGKELALTPLEFNILWYLCEQRGRVVSSEQLFETVWGEKYLDNNNTVMAHIARIREKLHEPTRKPKFIKTVWGVGYTIEE